MLILNKNDIIQHVDLNKNLIPIIENAGGLITTWNNKSAEKGGNILATSNKKLHYKLLRILRS